MDSPADKPKGTVLRPEAEHEGPLWKHPYAIYVWLTCILFVVILVAAWLALSNGWLPQR